MPPDLLPMPSSTSTAPRLLDTPDALAALVERLDVAPIVALDTEFVRESTYYAQLCLVQVGTPALIACVDPLAGLDLDAFWKVVLRAEPLMLMHAARQDLELIRQHTGLLPETLFDTQVAAALLGHPAQIGYAALVERLLGVPLDKSHARTDWSRRPLPPEKLAYAADDVRHLPEIHLQLAEALEARGRAEWAVEDCGALLAPSLYENPPEEAWQRVKGLRRLQGRRRAVARALAAWRELEAERVNRPRRWILADEQLLALAAAAPDSRARLEAVPGLPAGLLRRCGEALLQVIAAAGDGSEEAADPDPLSDREKATLARLTEITRRVASELEIEPEVLATRAELTSAARGMPVGRPFTGWRAGCLGGRLADALG